MNPLPKFPHAFTVNVDRWEEDGTRRGVGVACDGGKDLSRALAVAFEWSTFYAGPAGCAVTIYAYCDACDGNPRVRSGKRVVTCAHCKGKGVPTLILDYTAKPSEHVQIKRTHEPIAKFRGLKYVDVQEV